MNIAALGLLAVSVGAMAMSGIAAGLGIYVLARGDISGGIGGEIFAAMFLAVSIGAWRAWRAREAK